MPNDAERIAEKFAEELCEQIEKECCDDPFTFNEVVCKGVIATRLTALIAVARAAEIPESVSPIYDYGDEGRPTNVIEFCCNHCGEHGDTEEQITHLEDCLGVALNNLRKLCPEVLA